MQQFLFFVCYIFCIQCICGFINDICGFINDICGFINDICGFINAVLRILTDYSVDLFRSAETIVLVEELKMFFSDPRHLNEQVIK